jgi:putative ABC transport system permease protein
LRVLFLFAAIGVSTTLFSSVVRVSTAGVVSFEESIGYSTNTYPLTIRTRGGAIQLNDLSDCLSSLSSHFSFIAYKREVGELSLSGVSYPIAIIGVTGFGNQESRIRDPQLIYLSKETVERFQLSPNDTLNFKIAGDILSANWSIDEALSAHLASDSAVLPLDRLYSAKGNLLKLPHTVDAILLKPKVSTDKEALLALELKEWLSSCSKSQVAYEIDTGESRATLGRNLLASYRLNIIVMASLTLLVCVLLISQATALSLRTLSRELSILRTLGVGSGGCLLLVVAEAALISLLGALLGVTIGEPLMVKVSELFSDTAQEIYSLSLDQDRVALSGSTRIAIALAMSIMCIAGALFGAIGALRVAPSIGTRSLFRQAQPIRLSWALTLALLGILLEVVVATLAHTFDHSQALAYISVTATVVSVVSLMPLVVALAPRLITADSRILSLWFARGGVATNGRGFVLGASGAAVSITLICALSIMVSSFRGTLEGWITKRLAGDLFISAALNGDGDEARISDDIRSNIANFDGIKWVIPYYETLVSYRGSPLVVSATNIALQIERGVYTVKQGNLERKGLLAGAHALASESAARKLGVGVGSELIIDGRSLKISAIIQDFGTEHPLIHIDDSLFLSLYPGHLAKNLTIDILEDEIGALKSDKVSKLKAALSTVVGASAIVRNNSELRDLVLNLFDRTFRITLSIRWIVFGIALLGLTLAALQHLWERRREIKTMYVIGFSRVEILIAYTAEAAAVCALPVVIGIFAGCYLGWGLTDLLNPRVFGWSLNFNLSLAPLFIAAGFMIGVPCVVGSALALSLGHTIRQATLADE